jgi:hypothetical protein
MNRTKTAVQHLNERFFPAKEPRTTTTGRVMATITSEQLSAPADQGRNGAFAEIRSFWRQFFVRAFDPYRPELHYMRGPGPAWRAKHQAVSPAVQTMVVQIRAAKTRRATASI